MLPLNSNKELYSLLLNASKELDKKLSPVFLESITKGELVTAPTGNINVTPERIHWFTISIIEYNTFIKFLYTQLIQYNLENTYSFPAGIFDNFFPLEPKMKDYVYKNNLDEIIRSRNTVYQLLWNKTSFEEKKKVLPISFATNCSFAYHYNDIGTDNDIFINEEKLMRLDYHSLVRDIGAVMFRSSNQAIQIMITSDRKSKNLCQYCGGSFKGFLSKTCSICGKKKDY